MKASEMHPPSEDKKIKVICERYELAIWDDLDDEEVDKAYEELYLR